MGYSPACMIHKKQTYLNEGIFLKLKDPNVFNTVRVSFDTVELTQLYPSAILIITNMPPPHPGSYPAHIQ